MRHSSRLQSRHGVGLAWLHLPLTIRFCRCGHLRTRGLFSSIRWTRILIKRDKRFYSFRMFSPAATSTVAFGASADDGLQRTKVACARTCAATYRFSNQATNLQRLHSRHFIDRSVDQLFGTNVSVLRHTVRAQVSIKSNCLSTYPLAHAYLVRRIGT